MRIRLAVIIAIFACALSACASAPGRGFTPESSIGSEANSESTSTTIPALALSPYGGGKREVLLFNSLYGQIKQINLKSGPIGGGWLAFDDAANLYMADDGNPNPWGYNLLIFSPPYDKPTTTISVKPNHSADGIAIDPKTGVFALIANGHDVEDNAEVLFFRHGETRPCATVNFGSAVLGTTSTFDAEGNLFLVQYSGPTLVSVAGECQAKSAVAYSPNLPNTVDFIQFNTADQLIVDSGSLDVLTYPHPKSGELGQPIKSTGLDEANGQYVSVRALSKDGKTLFAAPYYKPNVYMYHYPEGGAPFRTIQTAAVSPAVAANPPLVP